jgi:hypothetical protein
MNTERNKVNFKEQMEGMIFYLNLPPSANLPPKSCREIEQINVNK